MSWANMYICSTCYGHLKKQSEPPQAVWNKLGIVSPPEILSNLNRLERVSISRGILFKKFTVMPKGRFPKLKGSICNIPVESNDITNALPRSADSNGLLIVKACVRYFLSNFYFSPNDSPSKTMKNVFYFI